ncbi:hypothetical protein [Thalassobaculum litoreum]|uniref:Uncharacterized protein n=1 Tax=Thalassobaculum litoreum DSM 18839 TaxID=1123362 RepID=A0A8G2EZK5_9PROT|nr:hypothetical protein [Thalassobaculum litoreum]SDG08560.1 hypothetical protein SAMN05660686_03297 [Thalassobaculum litoreum DSM 18839]
MRLSPPRPEASQRHLSVIESGCNAPSREIILRLEAGILSFLSTTTVFGTALDIILSELAMEALFPADDETAAVLLDGRRKG